MQLPEALFNLTSNAAEVRNASEELLKSFPDDQLIANLLQCLTFECPDATTQTVVRSMAAVVLRRKLTGGTQVLYKALSADVQRQVKAALLEGLVKQQVATIGRKVCDTIVDLAVVVYQDSQWDELMPCVGQLLNSAVEAHHLFGFRILQQLLELAPTNFSPPPLLRDVLQAGMASGNLAVQVAAIKVYTAAVINYEALSKDSSFDMSANVLKILEQCLNSPEKQEETEQILRTLVELLDSKPSILGNQIQSCLPTMVQVCRNSSTPEDIRRLALDFVVSTIEGFPEQPPSVLRDVLKLAMSYMLEIEEDPNWDTQNTDYDTSEDALVEAGQLAVTSLGRALPSSVFFPALSATLSEYAMGSHWKSRHAALLAVVQTADQLKEDHVQQLMPYVLVSLQDSSVRVQWAAAQAISQLLTEHGEWLADECYAEFMPVLLDKMQSGVPRVVAWVCAAVRDICEHLSAEDQAPYLTRLLGQCLVLLQQGPWFVVEKAFQTVSWVADVVNEAFCPYYAPYETLLYQLVEHPPNERENVRGRAMECMTSVGRAVGRDMFRPAAIRFLELSLSIAITKSGQFPTGWSSYYVLGAWRRTIEVLEAEIVPFLPRMVPMLLCIAGADVIAEGNWDDEDDSDDVQWVTDTNGLRRCVNPTMLEGKVAACEVLGFLMEHCKTDFWPYVGSTLDGIANLISFSLDTKVRCEAAECMGKVVECAGDAVTERSRLAARVVQWYLNALVTEKEPEVIVEILKAIREALKVAGAPLPEPGVPALLDALLVPMEGSAGRAAAAQAQLGKGEIDDEEMEELQNWEEAAMLRLVGCVGTLLKTQGDNALAVVDAKVQAMWASLTPTTEQMKWLVTIGMLCEVLEVAPPPLFQAYFTSCITQVRETCGAGGFFTPVRSLEVRRLAYAAMGHFAKSGGEAFVPHVLPTVSMCTAILSSDSDEEDDDQLRLRDTAAGTLAILLERYLQHVPKLEETLTIWLDWLPPHSDEDQLEPCITILCNLILSGPLAPSPTNMNLYGKALAVLSKLDPEDEDYTAEFKALVQSVVANSAQLFGDALASAVKGLTTSQRKKLEKWRH